MRQKILILLVLALWSEGALGAEGIPRSIEERIRAVFKPPPPRDLEEKVEDADLVVRGKATLFGEEKWVLDFVRTDTAYFGLGNDPLADNPYLPYTLYQRRLRVEVAEVLWPPSVKGITNIVFSCYVVKKWPPSWWAYTNTPGIFFLTRGHPADNEDWTRLDRYDDWIEPAAKALPVQAAITKIKIRGEQPIRQPNGPADGSQPFDSKTNRTSGAAGSRR